MQCQPPKNGRPGYLVVTSDFSENLRSTFTQLHRCFSTHYSDIMDIDDGEHALMPKLKNIYKTVSNFKIKHNFKVKHNLLGGQNIPRLPLPESVKDPGKFKNPVRGSRSDA